MLRLSNTAWTGVNFQGLVLCLFGLFIALGNSLRFIDLFSLRNHSLVTEAMLYFGCVLYLALFYQNLRSLFRWHWLCIYLSVSFLYGCWVHGFDLLAGMYALRLVAIIYSSLALAQVALEKFDRDPKRFLQFLLHAYLGAAILGVILFLVFPQAEALWAFLDKYNIKFGGDPHVQRFVSVYFDPNFYAVIASIPFMLATCLLSLTGQRRYFIAANFIAVTLIFTHSRSGVAVFLGLLCVMLFSWFRKRESFPSYKKMNVWFVVGCFLIDAVVFERHRAISQTIERISSVSDPSALCRFRAWQLGWETLGSFPLLGGGYNFTPKMQLWVDSSFLLFAICFGLVGTLVLAAIFMRGLFKLYLKWRHTEYALLIDSFCAYVLLSVFFFSFFNQVVSYPFWAIPVLVLYHFFNRLERTR